MAKGTKHQVMKVKKIKSVMKGHKPIIKASRKKNIIVTKGMILKHFEVLKKAVTSRLALIVRIINAKGDQVKVKNIKRVMKGNNPIIKASCKKKIIVTQEMIVNHFEVLKKAVANDTAALRRRGLLV